MTSTHKAWPGHTAETYAAGADEKLGQPTA